MSTDHRMKPTPLHDITNFDDDMPEWMFSDKRITWGERGGTGWIIVCYCQRDEKHFLALFLHARQTFPTLKVADVTCGEVLESGSVKGGTVITFPIKGPRKKYKGWMDWGDASTMDVFIGSNNVLAQK